MYAIVEIQGKQFKVKENDTLEIDTLNKEPGKITFDKVLLYAKDDKNIDIGHPYIDGAYVEAEILKAAKGEKIRVFKKKSKKRYERTQGFRRSLSIIQIKGIAFGAVNRPKASSAHTAEQAKSLDKKMENPKSDIKTDVKTEAKAPAKKTTRAKKTSSKDQAELF